MLQNILWTNETSSTNDLVRQYPSDTVLIAKKQLLGRGRQGKVWESTPNCLMFSYKFSCSKYFSNFGFLSIIAGCALHRAVSQLNTQQAFYLKWPNDLLDEQKQKLAGILLEKVNDFYVLGIGLNLKLTDGGSYSSLSLQIDSIWILKKIIENLDFFLELNIKETLDYWLENNVLIKGQQIIIETAGFKRAALFAGLANTGALIVKFENSDATSLVTDASSLRF